LSNRYNKQLNRKIMKTFQEWLAIKENMGVTGQSPVATGRQLPSPRMPYPPPKSNAASSYAAPPPYSPKNPNAASLEAAGQWKANGPQVRLSYLWRIPNAEKLRLHTMDWDALPPEAQQAAAKDMNAPSPFGQ